MTSFARLLRNAATLLRDPSIARDYGEYWTSRLRNSGQAVLTFPADITLTALCNFSEFRATRHFVSAAEREFLSTYPIGPGALIDVGANLGLVSVILARRFPDRPIHAFEPVPSTFEALQANIARNGCANIHPVAAAVGDHDGSVLFHANPMARGTNSIALAASEDTVPIPSTTLDSYAAEHALDEVAFLKVDVEGFEAAVFRGAHSILRDRRVATVYYEVCPGNAMRSGIEPAVATRLLHDQGYRIHRIGTRGRLDAVEPSALDTTVLENWVALRS